MRGELISQIENTSHEFVEFRSFDENQDVTEKDEGVQEGRSLPGLLPNFPNLLGGGLGQLGGLRGLNLAGLSQSLRRDGLNHFQDTLNAPGQNDYDQNQSETPR